MTRTSLAKSALLLAFAMSATATLATTMSGCFGTPKGDVELPAGVKAIVAEWDGRWKPLAEAPDGLVRAGMERDPRRRLEGVNDVQPYAWAGSRGRYRWMWVHYAGAEHRAEYAWFEANSDGDTDGMAAPRATIGARLPDEGYEPLIPPVASAPGGDRR